MPDRIHYLSAAPFVFATRAEALAASLEYEGASPDLPARVAYEVEPLRDGYRVFVKAPGWRSGYLAR